MAYRGVLQRIREEATEEMDKFVRDVEEKPEIATRNLVNLYGVVLQLYDSAIEEEDFIEAYQLLTSAKEARQRYWNQLALQELGLIPNRNST